MSTPSPVSTVSLVRIRLGYFGCKDTICHATERKNPVEITDPSMTGTGCMYKLRPTQGLIDNAASADGHLMDAYYIHM